MFDRIGNGVLACGMLAAIATAAVFLPPASRAGEPIRFEPQTLDERVAIGYGVAVGDVDGDGQPDILLADQKQIAWYRNGDWRKFVMAENLAPRDNVAIAARDLDGDGKVEIGVGGNWNPSETNDLEASGGVFTLVRPADPTAPWRVVAMPHEPTVHRMHWLADGHGGHELVVAPLHGRGNKGGQGAGVRVLSYAIPRDDPTRTTTALVDDSMHITHNFDVVEWDGDAAEEFLLAGREGVALLDRVGTDWSKQQLVPGEDGGMSEVRAGRLADGRRFLATVEPFHGGTLAVYLPGPNGAYARDVLKDSFREAHALVCGDFSGSGWDQIAVGWRQPDAEGRVGVRLFSSDAAARQWTEQTIDDNRMACEDLRAADLDGDGRVDLVASGRATHNLVIYWNRR